MDKTSSYQLRKIFVHKKMINTALICLSIYDVNFIMDRFFR